MTLRNNLILHRLFLLCGLRSKLLVHDEFISLNDGQNLGRVFLRFLIDCICINKINNNSVIISHE